MQEKSDKEFADTTEAPAAVEQIKANCYSSDDGDTWRDCPDDLDLVDGLKLGDTFELQASIRSWSETFRVTKVPDGTSDDYEVELVSSDAPLAPPRAAGVPAAAPDALPMQPVVLCAGDIVRFKENRIVSALLDKSSENGYGLNEIAMDAANGHFNFYERMRLAQLIGYSVSGYGDLSYASEESVHIADEFAAVREMWRRGGDCCLSILWIRSNNDLLQKLRSND